MLSGVLRDFVNSAELFSSALPYWMFLLSYVRDFAVSCEVTFIYCFICWEINFNVFLYTLWVKRVASTLKLFAIFSLVVNLCNWNYLGYCRNIFLRLHQFWSIYLNICTNCITCTSKTPQILTIQFSLLRNSWNFP